MIIAVSMRVVANNTYPELRDTISHDWVRVLDSLRVTPVLVPNVLLDPAAYLREIGAKGLILTGGDNLGPLPGEPTDQQAPTDRDRTETALLASTINLGLPVFGVCRGLQLVNVHFGGGVSRQLTGIGPHVASEHSVEIIAAPPLGELRLEHIVTNSYHNQGVFLQSLASDLTAFAVASGGLVEGLYHPELPVLAIQWHPERPNPASQLDLALLQSWLSLCE